MGCDEGNVEVVLDVQYVKCSITWELCSSNNRHGWLGKGKDSKMSVCNYCNQTVHDQCVREYTAVNHHPSKPVTSNNPGIETILWPPDRYIPVAFARQ
jgi:hypothetical protein